MSAAAVFVAKVQKVQIRKSPAHGEQSTPVVDELKGGDYNGSPLQGATAYDKR